MLPLSPFNFRPQKCANLWGEQIVISKLCTKDEAVPRRRNLNNIWPHFHLGNTSLAKQTTSQTYVSRWTEGLASSAESIPKFCESWDMIHESILYSIESIFFTAPRPTKSKIIDSPFLGIKIESSHDEIRKRRRQSMKARLPPHRLCSFTRLFAAALNGVGIVLHFKLHWGPVTEWGRAGFDLQFAVERSWRISDMSPPLRII